MQTEERRVLMPSSARMDALVLRAVQGMPSILRQHHISKASILERTRAFSTQVSEAYKKMEKTRARMSRTFVVLVTPLFFQILSIRLTAAFAICPRLTTSASQSPSLRIIDPK